MIHVARVIARLSVVSAARAQSMSPRLAPAALLPAADGHAQSVSRAMSGAVKVTVVDVAGRILVVSPAGLDWTKAEVCGLLAHPQIETWEDMRFFVGLTELVGDITLRDVNVSTEATVQLVRDASSDGVLSVVGPASRLQLLRARDASVAVTFPEDVTDVRDVIFSPTGRMLVTLSPDGQCLLWCAVSGKQRGELQHHRESVTCAAWSFDGELIVAGCSDGQARVWVAATATLVVGLLAERAARLRCVDFAPRDLRLVTSDAMGCTRIWSGLGWGDALTLAGCASSSRFAPAGDSIITRSPDGVGTVWRSLTGERVFQFPTTREQPLNRVAISRPQGDLLVCSNDRTRSLAVFGMADGRLHAILEGHDGRLIGAATSGCGTWIVSVAEDHCMKLWDWESGRCLWSYAMPGAAYVMSSFSSTSEWLVSLDSTGELTMWRACMGRRCQMTTLRARVNAAT